MLFRSNNLVVTSFTTLGNGISNYTSQNMGAQKMDRVREGFVSGMKLVWAICLPLVALYFFAGRWLLYLFMNDTASAMATETGLLFLRIVAPFYFVVSAKLVADGVLRGCAMMGRFMVATFTDLILRVALAIFLSGTALGSTGIWLAWPIGWAVGAAVSLVFYYTAVARAPQSEQICAEA